MTLTERLDKYTEPEPNTGCFLWTGSHSPNGYGRINVDGKPLYAHRVAYTLAKGVIPAGLDIDHTCRTRCCVNPEHLEAVTRRENVNRGLRGDLKDSTSSLRGVSWRKDCNKWEAQARKGVKSHHLGFFDTEEAAALAYETAVQELDGWKD